LKRNIPACDNCDVVIKKKCPCMKADEMARRNVPCSLKISSISVNIVKGN
jgi:hypothetical protein